jgi:hypothetical protein
MENADRQRGFHLSERLAAIAFPGGVDSYESQKDKVMLDTTGAQLSSNPSQAVSDLIIKMNNSWYAGSGVEVGITVSSGRGFVARRIVDASNESRHFQVHTDGMAGYFIYESQERPVKYHNEQGVLVSENQANVNVEWQKAIER